MVGAIVNIGVFDFCAFGDHSGRFLNDGWELLRQIAAEVGERQLENECREALEQEQEHLEKVRGWLLDMTIVRQCGSEQSLNRLRYRGPWVTHDLHDPMREHAGNVGGGSLNRGVAAQSGDRLLQLREMLQFLVADVPDVFRSRAELVVLGESFELLQKGLVARVP